jgi:hypothetical protein
MIHRDSIFPRYIHTSQAPGDEIGKLREVVDAIIRRRVNILCVQETK